MHSQPLGSSVIKESAGDHFRPNVHMNQNNPMNFNHEEMFGLCSQFGTETTPKKDVVFRYLGPENFVSLENSQDTNSSPTSILGSFTAEENQSHNSMDFEDIFPNKSGQEKIDDFDTFVDKLPIWHGFEENFSKYQNDLVPSTSQEILPKKISLSSSLEPTNWEL